MEITISRLDEELADMPDDSESRMSNSEHSPNSIVESMSENAIRKELKSIAIQHPTTIIPAAIAVISVVSLVLLSDFVPPRLAILVLILSALVSTGSFVWIYSFRQEEIRFSRSNPPPDMSSLAQAVADKSGVELYLR